MEINTLMQADPRAELLLQGRLHDPYAYLGLHRDEQGYVVRVFHPWASDISLVTAQGSQIMQLIHAAGLFEWHGSDEPAHPYQVLITENGNASLRHDPLLVCTANLKL